MPAQFDCQFELNFRTDALSQRNGSRKYSLKVAEVAQRIRLTLLLRLIGAMSIPVELLRRDVAVEAPPITIEVFESFLQCETKSKLYFQSAAETDSEFKNWPRRQRDCFKEEGISRLRTMCQEGEFYVGTASVEALKRKHWRIVADYIVTSAEICAQLDALELTSATLNRMASLYRPLRFENTREADRC
jgi:hypothetical protein